MCNLYEWWVRDGGDEAHQNEVDRALTAPLDMRDSTGRPIGFGDDDDIMAEFRSQL